MRRTTVSQRAFVTVALAVLASLFLAVSAPAGVVTRHYEFAEPTIRQTDDGHRVDVEGAWSYGDPGSPVLPVFGAQVLLPPGERAVGIRVTPGERIVLGDGYAVRAGQPQYPLSHEGPVEHVPPDDAIYLSANPYPGRLNDEARTGLFRGHGIASFALHPVEYVPSDGTLFYYRSMDVEIFTESDADVAERAAEMVGGGASTERQLRRIVDNPVEIAAYDGLRKAKKLVKGGASRILDPALDYEYAIITTDAWDDSLAAFADFQTQQGHKAGIFLKSWITTNYSGADVQEQIRNFIIDAYTTWDIDYVLLVGDAMDADGIPHRGLYASTAYGTTDEDIASDLYYAALDGNWNTDGDGYWGEPGEDDLYPEVAVGRACVSSLADLANFISKTKLYQEQPVVSECDEALMVGELLWASSSTYGGTYKEEIRLGASTHGYTTAGFPGTMNVGTLYDLDGTWAQAELITLLESGTNIVNHLGHSNVTYAMRCYTSDIPSFDNNGVNHSLNFVYSQGCYCGAFDNRDDTGSYIGESFAEEFTTDDDGAVAVVMNARYGWGEHGSTNGSSQYFDRQFFDAIFAEEIYPLGEVNNDSKVDNVWSINYGANRWCYYQLNLFGDPAMHLWTAEPTAMVVDHPSGIIVGQPAMTVNVTDSGSGAIEGAQVTIWTDDYSVYDTDFTDASGDVVLQPNATSTGTLYVKVTAHDHLVYDGSVGIGAAAGPYLVYASHVVDDDQSGDSNGNGDGVATAGETIELVVTIENVGTAGATGVSATLSTASGYATITDDSEDYGNIPSEASATCSEDYDVVIDGGTPDGTTIPFDLTITSGRETWESSMNIQVAAPSVIFESMTADDSPGGGNGDGCVAPGETVTLTVSLENVGAAVVNNLSAELSALDPYVLINGGTGGIASLGSGSTGIVSPDFSITIKPECPVLHEITLELACSGDWGYSSSDQFTLRTSGESFADDVESGAGFWTHGSVTSGFGDQWHVETHRSHSTSHSWKFGGDSGADYANSSDGALVMPNVCLGANGQMTFWSWLSAEEESSSSAWDCCLVEISTDGGSNWSTLVPSGGYSHTKNSNPANPLPEGTPCWSGSHSWRQETFDLSSYEGMNVLVRFRFASDGYVTEEGWYIDDIQLTSDAGTTFVEDIPGPAAFRLHQNAPNPFNPVTVVSYDLPEPAHVRIQVFNIAGRLVRTLVDEHQESGYRTAVWDGTNDAGQKVASGVYLYRMTSGEHEFRRRMVLLK